MSDYNFTHEGWFWFLPIYYKVDTDGVPILEPKYNLPFFLIDLVAFLQNSFGMLCEIVNPDYESEGFEVKLREIKKKS